MSEIPDALDRERAVDTARSFCVSAPAGSGKTELLIQRYLALLARAERPEQVLAITFTRKAAAEMRERVVQALTAAQDGVAVDTAHERRTRTLALAALEADTDGQWQLTRDVTRFNIKTIDSFCLSLTRRMPVLSGVGGPVAPQDDATELYERAVAALFAHLGGDSQPAHSLRALLSAFDNKLEQLQRLLLLMLRKRGQWSRYMGWQESPDEAEHYLISAVNEVISDVLASNSRQLAPFAAELLELARFAAENLGKPVPDELPQTTPQDIGIWRFLADLLLTKGDTLRVKVDKNTGFPPEKTPDNVAKKARMIALLEELGHVEGLAEQLAVVRYLPAPSEGSASWQLVVELSHVLPLLAAELLLVFQAAGTVDHAQIAELALEALGDEERPTELALRLDYRFEHILIDEFQDTSNTQFELLRRLTRGWSEHNAEQPERPRTLLLVGDPMQSIYGFRDANVALFEQARRTGFNGVKLEPLQLTCNFRSHSGVVEWVNSTFAAAFPSVRDDVRSNIAYTPAQAVRGALQGKPVHLRAFYGEHAIAAEALSVATQIAEAVAAGETSIAVLGRVRNHIRPIATELRALGVDYFAQDLESLDRAPVVIDLMTLCRALANESDRASWLALLRAPWCGLPLADLLQVSACADSARFTPLRITLQDPALDAHLSPDGRARLRHVRGALAWAWQNRERRGLRAWIETVWSRLGGAESVPSASALADAETFFQLLESAEAGGRGLDITWLESQLSGRYVKGGNPDSPVHLLTIHKAKGLEFERVFIPRLATSPGGGNDAELMLWDEYVPQDNGPLFLLATRNPSATGKNKADREVTLYDFLQHMRSHRERMEAARLMYVGATRAIRQLHLSACMSWDENQERVKSPPKASLLHTIWDTAEGQLEVTEAASTQKPASDEPGQQLWRIDPDTLSPARDSIDLGGDAVVAKIPIAPQGLNHPDNPLANHFERAVGTVVHEALEHFSMLVELPVVLSSDDKKRWSVALQQLGIAQSDLQDALQQVEAALQVTLQGEEGRWVLSSHHRDARSEWELNTVSAEGAGRTYIIDRSFVDEATGQRWIIDYKTSRPAQSESTAAFLGREREHYREQLMSYREMLRHLGPEPVRCALFFTALGELHPLPELDT